MQTQKDEVKQKILNAAVEEFLVSGYESSSMRVIAANAGITVGNIYSYFTGKDDLFETIVLPAVNQIKGLILMDVPTDNRITEESAIEIANQIISAFLCYHQEFLILMNSAKGSAYENIRSVLQHQIKERLIIELIPQLKEREENKILIDTLSIVLLDGIINIILKSDSNETMNRLIYDFLLLMFGDIENRIKFL